MKNARGEWDKEYAAVVNAVFPFARCAAHLGGEGWGGAAVSYFDTQMRIYVLDDSPEQVERRMFTEGIAVASRFSKRVSSAHSMQGEWRRSTVTYALWYGDYGGTATVDVYSRALASQTAALVFMHVGGPESGDVQGIVESFKWHALHTAPSTPMQSPGSVGD